MACLCEGGNEPPGSLKRICNHQLLLPLSPAAQNAAVSPLLSMPRAAPQCTVEPVSTHVRPALLRDAGREERERGEERRGEERRGEERRGEERRGEERRGEERRGEERKYVEKILVTIIMKNNSSRVLSQRNLLSDLEEAPSRNSEQETWDADHHDNVLHHDNARPHTARVTQNLISKFGWEQIDRPPYSPDFAQSDFHLFLHLKKFLGGQRFDGDNEVKTAVREWFAS
ncbi:hypothetical protein ANN_04064 [Periplaneta americana]|uniref:Histone-lysine N-methyltransferase SETMAR n=1 Tax=Periplaneta americana TaxID=6978 RepID=A0ABQ8T897_PERAM|nr:hypothetical protein ANN_04064 [Periplaneta americana]